MIAYLKDRIAYWVDRKERQAQALVDTGQPVVPYSPVFTHGSTTYLSDFGPNVPVEDLGGKPVYFENNQPVYPGREKAP